MFFQQTMEMIFSCYSGTFSALNILLSLSIHYTHIPVSWEILFLADSHSYTASFDKFDKFIFIFSLYPKGLRPMRADSHSYTASFDKFDKFIFIISKRSQTHEENTCRIILYTLSLNRKLHTCIIPCNTTLVWHVDKISSKYTHAYHAYIYNITVLNRFKEFIKPPSIQFLSR